MNNALEIPQNVSFLLSAHSLQNSFELAFIFPINDSFCKDFRLDVLKTECSFIERTTLNDFYILIADDWLDCVVRLMLDYLV